MRRKAESLTVDLRGCLAIVTGGGTGIGRAISLALARCGASVVVNYRRSQREAEQTVKAIERQGGRSIAVCADVTDEEQVAALVEAAVKSLGLLDDGGSDGLPECVLSRAFNSRTAACSSAICACNSTASLAHWARCGQPEDVGTDAFTPSISVQIADLR